MNRLLNTLTLRRVKYLLPFSLCFLSACCLHASEQPNVVIILTDDLGYGDLECYGGKGAKTPAIDDLAKEGIRFTHAYAPSATCTPTRYALLTGEYAWRQPSKKTSILDGNAPLAIDVGRTTIATLLKDAGYATGVVGKWHLGLGDGKKRLDFNGSIKPGPIEIGFGYSYIIPATVDRVPSVWVENHHVDNLDLNDPIEVSYLKNITGEKIAWERKDELKVDADKQHSCSIHNGISRIGYQKGGMSARFIDEELPMTVVEKSNAFIRAHKDHPFFLLVGLFEPHVPRTPHKKFAGKSESGVRGDVIMQIDWQVEQIMKELKKQKLEDDTIVIFTSDNGPVLFDGYYDRAEEDLKGHQPTAGLKGWKYLVYEGGTRVPLIVKWPDAIPGGETNDQIFSLTDVISTLSAITGEKIPAGEAPDSLNMYPLLKGEVAAGPRASIVLHGVSNAYALRQGNWKFVKANASKEASGIGSGADPNDTRFAAAIIRENKLFDLEKDPFEQNNLAQEMPEKVDKMREELEKIMR
jgi:arylsulfatase A-like enzyme